MIDIHCPVCLTEVVIPAADRPSVYTCPLCHGYITREVVTTVSYRVVYSELMTTVATQYRIPRPIPVKGNAPRCTCGGAGILRSADDERYKFECSTCKRAWSEPV